MQVSLSHAKVLENISQDFVGCYLAACYVCKLFKANAEVFADYISAETYFHGLEDAGDTFVCMRKSFIMADIRYDDAVFVDLRDMRVGIDCIL